MPANINTSSPNGAGLPPENPANNTTKKPVKNDGFDVKTTDGGNIKLYDRNKTSWKAAPLTIANSNVSYISNGSRAKSADGHFFGGGIVSKTVEEFKTFNFKPSKRTTFTWDTSGRRDPGTVKPIYKWVDPMDGSGATQTLVGLAESDGTGNYKFYKKGDFSNPLNKFDDLIS
ncbi:MAG: hypothetical protein HEQ32_05505 [Vampirovibrio sp.]